MLRNSTQAADAGKRQAALFHFLKCYREARPEVLEQLRDRVQPPKAPARRLQDLRPEDDPALVEYGRAVRAWASDFHLPPTWDMAIEALHTIEMLANLSKLLWHCELIYRLDATYEHDSVYDFSFNMEGWRPRIETIEQAKRRIKQGFQDHLRLSLDEWKRQRQAKALEEALSASAREGLRLLALRQAHGLTYDALAERATLLRRRWEETADGGKQLAETLTPEETRRKVNEAAGLIGLKVRRSQTGRPRSPKTPK